MNIGNKLRQLNDFELYRLIPRDIKILIHKRILDDVFDINRVSSDPKKSYSIFKLKTIAKNLNLIDDISYYITRENLVKNIREFYIKMVLPHIHNL